MLGTRKWLSVTMVVILTTIGLSASVGADSGSEQGFLSKINSSRSANGLAPVKMDGGLQSHARKHTQDMIAADQIYHSTSAELKAAAGSGWSALAENVGRGGTVDSLHNAFMNSAGHRKNILGDYNYVGIGTDTSSDGKLYVTVVFMRKGSTAPPATTTTTKATNTTVKPKPKPTTTTTQATTTTTLPPTTTTTLIVGPDKPVTPGESCFAATRYGWMCHD